MLQVGDTVVYPMHGAGVISGIEDCEVLGEGKSYYVLQMPLGNMKVMIPTDNVDNMGLRDVIPETQVEEVKDILQMAPERATGSWNKRFHANLERMKISSGERRLLDLARQIIVSELVYACSKSPEEVKSWMDGILAENDFA